MNNLINTLKNKKVLIFGLGIQGGALKDAQYLHKHDVNIKVTDLKKASDLQKSLDALPKNIPATLGGHKKSDIDWADIIIKNPGVPDNNDYLIYARSQNKPIFLSAALHAKYAKTPIIAVTGTRGKSTTTHLIYETLSSKWPGKILLGGNIPGKSSLALLDLEEGKKYTVLELSSFQLHGFHDLKVSPHIAIFTNFYQDHLNRYKGMTEYLYDKSAITMYQSSTDIFIVNKQFPALKDLAKQTKAVVYYFDIQDVKGLKTLLPGKHNQENISAVYKLCDLLDIDISYLKETLQEFHSLPFRLQKIKVINGVTFINDTTSTTPTSTIKAIESIDQPIHIIVGGPSKNLEISAMMKKLDSTQIKSITVLGSADNKQFLKALKEIKHKPITYTSNMKQAVQTAYDQAEKQDTVLLSPGFFSFDLFDNEFDRGRQFNNEVNKLT